MAVSKDIIKRNLQRVRENVAGACARARRDAAKVTIVAVTKTVEMDEIRSLLELGVGDLGESRVQQLIERAQQTAAIAAEAGRPAARWHMIGHLQRNKVKPVLDCGPVVHSLDSLRLAEDMNVRAERLGQRVDVLLQVNCSQEPQKFGVAVGAASHLADMLSHLKHLRLVGLMTMAPLVEDAQAARPTFVRLRELFEDMRHEGIGGDAFVHLSMGMSNDYVVAVEEGATIIRIGSALFQ